MTSIAQRDLRNLSGEYLRRAERGQSFVVTIDGRPVAQLGPIPRRQWVAREVLARVLRESPSDPSLARDLARHGAKLDPREDPWARRGG